MPYATNPNTGHLEKIPNPFYHGTDPENLPSILRRGLVGGLSEASRRGYGGAFITKSLNKARSLGDAILEIRLPLHWQLEYDEGPQDFETTRSIPPKFIRIKEIN